MVIHRTNLLSALHIAMKVRREEEAKTGYTGDSIFVAGLQEVFDKLKAGEQLCVIGEAE